MFERVLEKRHGHPARAVSWHRHPADDSWAPSPCHYLIWTCAILLSLAGGCERAATTPPSQAQTVQENRPEPPQPAAPAAPLLLEEDEPAGRASNGPAADNSRCFVCHVNYMEEKLATTHAKANTGCAACHGPSDAHIADESWASGGNGTAPDRMYTRDKINASCMACHPKDKIDTPQHTAVLADTEGKKVCTDCHGEHRLPRRQCQWK
jgi:hypothetical protein